MVEYFWHPERGVISFPELATTDFLDENPHLIGLLSATIHNGTIHEYGYYFYELESKKIQYYFEEANYNEINSDFRNILREIANAGKP